MEFCSDLSDPRGYSLEMILEVELDIMKIAKLTKGIYTNKGRPREFMFLILKRDKLTFGSLPTVTSKMWKIIHDNGCYVSEMSLMKTLRENRKAFLVSLSGEYMLIKNSDILFFLFLKIRRDFCDRNIIKRETDFDSVFTLLTLNYSEEAEHLKVCEDDLCNDHKCDNKTFTRQIGTAANKNKNVEQIQKPKKERNSSVSAVPARKRHATTFIDFEVIAAPNDSQKYNNPNFDSDDRASRDTHPVQVTESDAGQLSLEPWKRTDTSRYHGNAYYVYHGRDTSSFLARESGNERRNLIASGSGIRNSNPPRYRDYVEESQRNMSFLSTKWLAGNKPEVSVLVEWGFFFTGVHDLVRCHQCGIGLKDWVREDDVLNEHVKHSSSCDFLIQKLGKAQYDRMKIALSNPERRAERDSRLSEDIQLPYKIRSPRYQTMEARMASFQNFPEHIQIPAQQLAVSGLFYTGKGDLCRCFTCDGGLKDWTTGDDPVEEHAKHFSRCAYINQLKGQAFVQAVQKQNVSSSESEGASGGNGTVSQPEQVSSDTPIEKLHITDSSYSGFQVSQVVQQCGYAEIDVITAKAELERNGNKCPTAEDIVNTILDLQERSGNSNVVEPPERSEDDLQSLMDENEKLAQLVYCKLCVTAEADILFLPCTHHRICHECAVGVTSCPVCNRQIKQKIKTFRS